MRPPNLLVCAKLTDPLRRAEQRVDAILTEVGTNRPQLLFDGSVALSVAYLDVALNDVLRYYLWCFPQKLKEVSSKHEEALIWQPDLLYAHIDRRLLELSYRDLGTYLQQFCSILSLPFDDFGGESTDQLTELKARRNLLLHNDLKVNQKYLESAGPLGGNCKIGNTLKIDAEYVRESMTALKGFLATLIAAVTAKYSKYTRVSATRRLWEFMFSTPILAFDDMWTIDEDRDIVTSFKEEGCTGLPSSSERMILATWRSHFDLLGRDLKNFSMYKLDQSNRARMLYFLSVVDFFREG